MTNIYLRLASEPVPQGHKIYKFGQIVHIHCYHILSLSDFSFEADKKKFCQRLT